VEAIVEEKDATATQKEITEINTGFLACPTTLLAKWLPTLGNKNAQGEQYLTDILALAVNAGVDVVTLSPADAWEVTGINSKDQLAALERVHQRNIAIQLMQGGVTLADPERLDVRGELVCGDGTRNDVSIDVNCIFEGKVVLAPNVKIGANCILRNCTIGAGTEVLPFSHIDGATIGENARIGPYARIRPGSTLNDDVHIGNFVEVKASEFGNGSKANHLTYIGDTTVGKNVNIGAGTITCNYDGANKHRTVIEDNVYIGSDVQLVAPVTIGEGADIGAGTTVWKDVAPGGLTLNEKTQVRKPDWKRPVKKK
ncbi:MAG: bifunctional UDP-N-acetylglucosamine diphosphorylase/glucosamine-1-phosphate N-acetyltransferase GlmU, partial [Burkholderiales bacterium]|nr:bifunctional UDP-N-acetylglucosamine diphosphorylase/glucosamine-1-phosphate N-acetyltransferase GlmU [Burkholderiales bacterium]